MQIVLQDTGKKFGRSWIFRELSYTFHEGGKYAILGGNGSGKSTLLQVIAGYLSPNSGKVWYERDGKKLGTEHFFRYISMATPYMELPEEFTLAEILKFHARFKNPLLPLEQIPARIGLEKEKQKAVKNFSSGMRQRLRLGLSLLFESSIILLDEPTSHLDTKAIAWYHGLTEQYAPGRCLIISSNVEEEYSMCSHYLHVENYKKAAKR